MHTQAQQEMCYNRRNRGYITLMSVLILGVVGVTMTMALLLLGLSSSRTSFAYETSFQAKALADACAEDGLQQIRDNTDFTGTGNRTLGRGFCTYTITSSGQQNRTVVSSGTVGNVTRKVKIDITSISPTIEIALWQEVASF